MFRLNNAQLLASSLLAQLERFCANLQTNSLKAAPLRLSLASLALASTLAVWPAQAAPVSRDEVGSRTERLPPRLKGVDVEEHLDAQVPQALSFVDDQGRTVLYDEVVRGALPTILTMNYSDCPMLCSLQINALMASMK